MNSGRTDLAMENLHEDHALSGIDIHKRTQSGIGITEVIVKTDAAARKIGKPIGRYLTLECARLTGHDADARIAMARLLGSELSALIKPKGDAPVLVVGLGNRGVTPDALGPAAIDKTLVTRHMLQSGYTCEGMRSVCAIAPGVLGVTGIETVEMVESLIDKLHPNGILCIDSLAARDASRIGCTVQISNTGIQPGSGVGNHRKPLTRESVGVDVIAVGVPTVIYAAALARDAFALLSHTDESAAEIERDLLNTDLGSMIVTPRDIDLIIDICADIIAGGINRALQPNLTEAQIRELQG